MPMISQIICDRCQAVKKETNHWYTLVVTEEGAFIRPMALTPFRCRLHAADAISLWAALCD